MGEALQVFDVEILSVERGYGYALHNWNNAKVDLDEELRYILNSGDFNKLGDGHKQQESEKLNIEILISPTVAKLTQTLKLFLGISYEYRQIIFAGTQFKKCGSWALKDGTFGVNQFNEVCLKEIDGSDTIFVNDLSSFAALSKSNIAKMYKITELPPNRIESSCIEEFVSGIESIAKPFDACVSLEDSQQTGQLTYSRPTVYILPAGSGDCTLFGVSGFNLLINTGYEMDSCFWTLLRHCVNLDCLAITHASPDNLFGLQSLVKKIDQSKTPKITYCLTNISPLENAEPTGDSQVLDAATELRHLISRLKSNGTIISPPMNIGLKPTSFKLYFKVGYGSLDVYPITSPVRKSHDSGNKSSVKSSSMAFILVWSQVNKPESKILVPGDLTQAKLLEGLEQYKHLEIIQAPIVKVKVMKKETVKLKTKLGDVTTKITDSKPQSNSETRKLESSKSTISKAASLKTNRIHSTISTKPISGSIAATTKRLFSSKSETKPKLSENRKTNKSKPAPSTSIISNNSTAKTASANGHKTKTKKISPVKSQTTTIVGSPKARSVKNASKSKKTPDKRANEGELNKLQPVTTEILSSETNNALTEQLEHCNTKQTSSELEVSNSDLVEINKTKENDNESNIETDNHSNTQSEFTSDSQMNNQQQIQQRQFREPSNDSLDNGINNYDEIKGNLRDDSVERDDFDKSPVPKINAAEIDSPSQVIFIGSDQEKEVNVFGDDKLISLSSPQELLSNQTFDLPGGISNPINLLDDLPSDLKENFGQPGILTDDSPINHTDVDLLIKTNNSKVSDNLIEIADNETLLFEESVKREEEAMLRAHVMMNQPEPHCQSPSIVEETVEDHLGEQLNGWTNEKQVSDPWRDQLHDSPLGLPTATALNQSKDKAILKKPARKSIIPSSKLSPICVDMTFIPCHGDMKFLNIDYFTKIRARYYILSSLNPSVELFNTLLAAKKLWPENTEVTVIPTYINESIMYWFSTNKEDVEKYNINISSPASNCSIKLFNETMAGYHVEL